MKKCKSCNIEKEYSEYHKDKTVKSGIRAICKTCANKRRKERFNPVKVKKCSLCKVEKISCEFHKNSYRHDGLSTYCRDCEKIKSKDRREYQRDLSKQPHVKERRNKKEMERYYTDPIYKLKKSIRGRIYDYIKGESKVRSSQIIGCTWEYFRDYIEQQFTKGMTWNNHGEWHLDHIIPLSSAKTEEEVYKLNHYTNLQPLWAEENLKKSDKIFDFSEIE